MPGRRNGTRGVNKVRNRVLVLWVFFVPIVVSGSHQVFKKCLLSRHIKLVNGWCSTSYAIR